MEGLYKAKSPLFFAAQLVHHQHCNIAVESAVTIIILIYHEEKFFKNVGKNNIEEVANKFYSNLILQ